MNVYVTWEHDPQIDIFLKRSTDNGATWKSVKNLSNDGGKSTLSQIAISNANVYVIWVDYTDTIDTVGVGDIFFKRSTDNGATWKPTVNISNNPGESVLARVSASGDNVYVVWQQTSASLTSVDIILRRSTDNGATWKSPINVSNDPDGSLNPQIASTGTNVYVVWEKYSDSDILFKRSADGGATWKSVKNLSNSNQWTGNPDVAVSGSDVFVAWREGDPGLAGNIFVKWSTNDGSTWIYKKKLCDNNGNSDFAQIGL
jgi:Neuraminidase (sialidase)